MADPTADYWTMDDVADHWQVTPQTIRTYRSRKRGELPEPDRMFGRSPVWRPKTIIEFQRPGQGARTDLRAAPAEGEPEQLAAPTSEDVDGAPTDSAEAVDESAPSTS